jgi:hypothetical protein
MNAGFLFKNQSRKAIYFMIKYSNGIVLPNRIEYMEGWLSGRKYLTANEASCNGTEGSNPSPSAK